jgi:hypothetical protein
MVKKTCNAVVVLILLVLSQSCGNNGSGSLSINRNSRVEHFEYQGYGDTVVAMLFGEILAELPDSPGVLKPLKEVQVSVDSAGKTVTTDSIGTFELGLFSGTYTLTANKSGYQPLHISQYVADGDRVSIIKIILSVGDSMQHFIIPQDKKPTTIQ